MARDTSLLPVFFSFVVLVVLVVAPSPASASADLVNQTCHRVGKRDVCLKNLLHAPWAVQCGDVRCLAGQTITQLAQPAALAARNYVVVLQQQKSRPEWAAALSSCLHYYDLVVSSLGDSLKQLNNGDYLEANASASIAEYQMSACEDAFAEKPTPMTDRNRAVGDIVGVAGGIVDLLNG